MNWNILAVNRPEWNKLLKKKETNRQRTLEQMITIAMTFIIRL